MHHHILSIVWLCSRMRKCINPRTPIPASSKPDKVLSSGKLDRKLPLGQPAKKISAGKRPRKVFDEEEINRKTEEETMADAVKQSQVFVPKQVARPAIQEPKVWGTCSDAKKSSFFWIFFFFCEKNKFFFFKQVFFF